MSKKLFYDAIKQQITDKVDTISFEGYYNGQFEAEEMTRANKWPCCYFQFNVIEWSAAVGLAPKIQNGEIEFSIQLGFKTINETPEIYLDEIDKISSALHGFTCGVLFDPIRRVSESQPTEYDNIYRWEIKFRTILKDETDANKGYVPHVVTSYELDKDLVIDNEILRTGKL